MQLTPNLHLELFAPLGVGWREDATAGALLDFNMMLIDTAFASAGAVASVNGKTGVVVLAAADVDADAAGTAASAVATEASARASADALLVPRTTTINAHALSSNVTLSFSDIAASALASGTTATTQSALDNSTKVSTTAYADAAVAVEAAARATADALLVTKASIVGTPNKVYATNASGSFTNPAALRALVIADIPALPESSITNLVSDLAGKQVSLGFTPENVANKDANSGYAGLDASSKLKPAEFPAPTASSFGGVKSLAAVSNKYITSIGTDGVPVAAQPQLSNLSDSPAANLVVASPNNASGTLSPRALVQSDLPSFAAQFANLPNVKLVPIYAQFQGSQVIDLYTVPAGRRALISGLIVTHDTLPAPANYAIDFQVCLKNSGNYYGITGPTAQPTVAVPLNIGTIGCIADAGEGFSALFPFSNTSQLQTNGIITAVAAATSTSLTLTAAVTQINSLTQYTGTITSGGQTMIGRKFVVSGFTNAGNNGTFTCVAATTTYLILENSGGVSETKAATAVFYTASYTALQVNGLPSLTGQLVTVTGCTNAANNGTFTLVSQSGSTVVLNNPNAVLEASPPSTAICTQLFRGTVAGLIVEYDSSSPLFSAKLYNPSGTKNLLYTPASGKNGCVTSVGSLTSVSGSLFNGSTFNTATLASIFYESNAALASTLTSASAVVNGLTTYSGNIIMGGGAFGTVSAATVSATLTLSAVAALSNGSSVYTCVGGSAAFVGMTFVVTGFTNSSNNGTFLCVSSSATTLALVNLLSVAETHAGSAAPSQSFTTYTVSGFPTLAARGMYVAINGMANAGNNGTFQVLYNTTTILILANSGGTTATAQTGVFNIEPFYGATLSVSGFANAGNNGSFIIKHSTVNGVVVANAGGVAETIAASASTPSIPTVSNALGTISVPQNSITSFGIANATVASGDSLYLVTNIQMSAAAYGPGLLAWVNVVEF